MSRLVRAAEHCRRGDRISAPAASWCDPAQESLTGKVGKIIEIYNPNRWMTFGGMGSQKLDAPNIEYIVNNDTHPGAQFSEQFRSVVKSELARLIAQDNLQTAQAKTLKPPQLAKLPPPKDV